MAKNQDNAQAEEAKRNSREKLVEKARTEYGIVNAENMSNAQLKSEMKALDDQSKSQDQDRQ